MKTATELKTEFNAAVKRIAELTEARKIAADKFQNSQNDFIKSKILLDDLQAEQSKLDLLDSLIKSLEIRQTELEAELQAAAKVEVHSDTLASLKTTALEAETAYNEYLSHRAEFDKLITLHLGKVDDTLTTYRAKQREFLLTFGKIAPGITSVRRPEISERAIVAQTAAELEGIGLGKESFKIAIEEHLQPPVLDNWEIVEFAQTNIGNRKHNERQRLKAASVKA